MNENRWVGIGRLTRAPEYKPAGRKGPAHVLFTLAINRVVSNENGPQADYVPCILWGDDAAKELCERCSKGDTVGVVGRIRTGRVPQANGSAQFFWEIRVEEIQYGMRSLKNLQPLPEVTSTTQAVSQLVTEFNR